MKSSALSETDLEAIQSAETHLGNTAVRAAIRDLFSLGLYLRVTGHPSEGYKACSIALRALAVSEACAGRILKHVDDDPTILSLLFQPHVEFHSLIEHEVSVSSSSI